MVTFATILSVSSQRVIKLLPKKLIKKRRKKNLSHCVSSRYLPKNLTVLELPFEGKNISIERTSDWEINMTQVSTLFNKR